MERLTKDKRTMCIVEDNQNKNYFNQIHDKLSKLEDLEEELGISLEVIFKALEKGFYYKSKTPDEIFMYPQINTTIGHQNGEWFIGYYTWWLTKDYGKTWALTKEELE